MSSPEVGPLAPVPNPALRRTAPDRRRSRERRHAFEDAVRRARQRADDAAEDPAPQPQPASPRALQQPAPDGRRDGQAGSGHVDVLA
jgi:hypothetical protein